MRSRSFGILLALAATAGACSSSGEADSATSEAAATSAADTATTGSTTAPTTTAGPETTAAAPETTIIVEDPAALAERFSGEGTYDVGVTELALPGGQQVVVWYPAPQGTTGTYSYDARDYTAEALRGLLTADIPATFTIDAGLDVPAAEGSFPVALYSHGFSGFNVTSSFMTSHLARYGVIVAAPQHPSRDLAAATSFAVGDQSTAVEELLGTIDLLEAENTRAGGSLAGRVDSSQITAIGHSAGGGTVLAAATDERIDGFVSLASGQLGRRDTESDTTVAPPSMPDKPSLFLAGTLDTVVPWDTVTRPAFDAAAAPSTLWAIDGVGHVGFTDICTLGDGLGIIGIAEASGLGPFLDTNPQFRALGQDGCLPPNLPVDQVWPVILNAVTAFVLRDEDPLAGAALGDAVADTYATDITVLVK